MSLDLFKLHGKTAWITGGTKGLGLQMANALASVGANIFVTSRHEAECAAAAKSIVRMNSQDREYRLKRPIAPDVRNRDPRTKVLRKPINPVMGL